MDHLIPKSVTHTRPVILANGWIWVVLLVLVITGSIFANPEISTSDDEKTLIVGEAPQTEVIAFSKSVIVEKHAKGVFSFGGDVTIEGRVDGDVATIGGSVIQKADAYVGGDIIVIGGSYRPESLTPKREPGKETILFGVWEDELRSVAQDPSQLLAPTLTWSFLTQRLLLALFWFLISVILTTIAPGAVGRAVARVQLSTLKVTALGSLAFVVTTFAIVASISVLPNFLSVTFGLMGIALLFFGYVFGRVALQMFVGKFAQKYLFAEHVRSETLATLLGVLALTIVLSIPFVWVLVLFTVFATGIGLILTARSNRSWQNT